MKVSCKYCGGVHDVGVTCERKPKKKFRYRRGVSQAVDVFRRGGVWRAKSLAIRERDFNCCRVCLELGHIYGTYAGKRAQTTQLSVHHIEPLANDYGKRLDDDNLITLCSYHHELAEDGTIKKDLLKELAANPVDFTSPGLL